ncbi:zinc-binding dehydrogenase [Streptosporangium sp. NPDC049248]|uniref:zinc-binding dehydrogenase n=1 Tax=Streptosporangium sp. NPDC049248 TaxID=3155651 RepID=UPI0034280CB8
MPCAGGVGHLTVQIAASRGAHVTGTGRAAKHDLLRELGADTLIDHTTADFVTETEPVDVVFDLVGGDYGERSASVLKPGGVLVGALGGNLGITGERAAELGVRLAVVNVRPSAADLSRLVALAESGRLRVHVDQTLPLAEVARAHELLSTRRTTGKIVLIP